MGSIHGHEPATALLTGTGELANDYEIQHILSVASAYLEAGQLHDANELLLEAREANPNHPGVKALAGKIDHILGYSEEVSDSREPEITERPDVLVHFTVPLPDVEKRPPAIQRLVKAADQYHARGMVYSSLDLTQILCAEQGDYIASFVRLAELQIELGMVEQAKGLYSTLKTYYEVIDEPAPWLVESLRVSLDPGDTTALVGYAMSLVEAGEVSALDPFVPEAISRAVDLNPEAAVDLAGAYVRLKPDDLPAMLLYLQVLAMSGNKPAFIENARRLAQQHPDDELQVMRLTAELMSREDAWLEQTELVVSFVRKQPALAKQAIEHILRLVGDSIDVRTRLALAAIAQAASLWEDSLDALSGINQHDCDNNIELFCTQFMLAIAKYELDDPESIDAMLVAAQTAYHEDVEPFATGTELFGRHADPASILATVTTRETGTQPLDVLMELRTSHPDRLDIRLALAEAHLQARDVKSALRELRFVAEREEQAGNLQNMIEAMRRISRAVPTNVEIKAKLIDGYMKRGILDEAVDEMDIVGGLYIERNRVGEAVATYTRAAEIAAALGKFDRGNSLFDRAVKADPDNVPVRHAAVAYYLQTGSLEQATEQLREVVRIALEENDRDEAVAALHQIIALAPQDASAYHKLGEVLTSLGEYTQAERVYRRLASFSAHDPVLEAKQSALAVLAAAR